MVNIRVCEICGVTSETNRVSYWKKFNKILCGKHYRQLKVYGEIRKTRYDKNEYIFKYNTCYMNTYRNDGSIKNTYTFDINHYEDVNKYKWYSNAYNYATTLINDKVYYLHDIIYNNIDKTMKIDHIDGNVFNNLDKNLREVTTQQNAFNSKISKNNTSGVTGVHKNNSLNGWIANIHIDSNRVLKFSKSFDKAVKYRLIFESKYSKEYSYNYNRDTNTIQLTYLSHDDNKQTYIEVDMDSNIIKFEKLSQ